MKIVEAKLSDVNNISEIENVCFPKEEAASLESIEKRVKVFGNHFFLLKEEEKIIGFVNGMVTDIEDLCDEMYEDANLHNENGKWQMIFGLDVLPEYQGKGYAGVLMRHIIDVSRKQGRSGIVLTCKERLIPLYAHFGFEDEGISNSEHGGVVWHQMRLKF